MPKILLIDDSPDIRALVRILLEQGGHAVIEAEEGRRGLELARRERPDLILTDLAMPGLSGWDIARILKSDPEMAATPVVAVTAHAMRGDRERALAIGCDGFIVKPIDDECFEPTIRSFLGGKAATATPPSPTGAKAEPSPVATSPARCGPFRSDTNGRKILVVDDNPGVVDLLRQCLKSDGFDVITAGDGPSALERIEEEAPELVVLDVMLPGMDGYQITSRIKRDRDAPFLPVVLVTAGSLDRERGLEVGADDFLGKPIDRTELLVRVRSLLRLRDAVEEARHQAEALRRLDQSKQRFIAAVVHDLRSPLNAMGLTLQTLRMAPPDPDQLLEDLDLLGRNIGQMDALLTSLLEYSLAVTGEQPLNLAPFSPRRLAEDVGESLAATAAHRGLDLSVRVEDNVPETVLSDYSKCRQVLFNLVANALKYTERGSVTVVVHADGPERWAVQVTDTGVGIAPEDRERIFEEFGQARIGRPSGAPGTGLGLAICRSLTNRLGGWLKVESEVGRGSTFTVNWPTTIEEDATVGDAAPSA